MSLTGRSPAKYAKGRERVNTKFSVLARLGPMIVQWTAVNIFI